MTRRLILIMPVKALLLLVAFLAAPFAAQPIIMYFEPLEGDLMAAGIQCFIPIMCAVIYGAYRALHFHPLINKKYGQWLATTPWTYGTPLPLGPIRIVWEDLIFIAVLILALYAGLWNWHNIADYGSAQSVQSKSAISVAARAVGMITAGFILTYLMLLTLTLRREGPVITAIAFIFPLMMYPHLNPWAGACVFILIAVLIWVGVRRSLKAFPWDRPEWARPPRDQMLHDMNRKGIIGWPYRQIGPPHTPPRSRGLTKMILPSMIVGWWILAFLHSFIIFLNKTTGQDAMAELADNLNTADRGAAPVLRFFWMGFVLVLAGTRLFAYLRDTMPPISLLGRIKTGRWLIPDYDKVFMAPLLLVLYGWFGPRLWAATGLPLILVPTLCVVGVMLMHMLLGPTQASWRHTGLYRSLAWGPPPKATKKQDNADSPVISFRLSNSSR